MGRGRASPLLQPWTIEVRVMDDRAADGANDTQAKRRHRRRSTR